ncbi:MAG: hypothetical protein IT579_07820 [Verrucomicrobia subdivision 3 bacterium]|nr:hypothetical protein [Verrucomicrobiota bacterium]MCC6820619.1 hypothetical protein [Limisphaerales bacterium]
MNQPRKHETGGPPSGLGELLAFGLQGPDAWTPEELEAALAEQISMPVEFELSALKPAEAKALRACAVAHGLVLKNLHDLFHHPHPPLELLVMAKEFFKANSLRPHPGLPAEVARALYYLTVAVALLRHHRRISTLSDAQVVSALDWLQQQRWVGEDLRQLAAEAAKQLHTSAGKGAEGA